MDFNPYASYSKQSSLFTKSLNSYSVTTKPGNTNSDINSPAYYKSYFFIYELPLINVSKQKTVLHFITSETLSNFII